MSEVTEYICQRLQLDGCQIEEKENQVIIHTPDILEYIGIIHLKDESEYAELAQLLNGKVLIQETRYIVDGIRPALIEIDILHIGHNPRKEQA